MGAKGQLGEVAQIQRLNQIVQFRFANAMNFEGSLVDRRLTAVPFDDPWQHRLAQHGTHLVGHAGKPQECFASTELDAKTGRRAVGVGDDYRTLGEDRLFEIVRRKCHAALCEARFERRRHAVVLFGLNAEQLSDQFCCQIICRRPQAAGADDDIAELLRLAQGPEHLVAVVADFHHRGDADA